MVFYQIPVERIVFTYGAEHVPRQVQFPHRVPVDRREAVEPATVVYPLVFSRRLLLERVVLHEQLPPPADEPAVHQRVGVDVAQRQHHHLVGERIEQRLVQTGVGRTVSGHFRHFLPNGADGPETAPGSSGSTSGSLGNVDAEDLTRKKRFPNIHGARHNFPKHQGDARSGPIGRRGEVHTVTPNTIEYLF